MKRAIIGIVSKHYASYKNNIPTLEICCGQNIVARAIGGTTYKSVCEKIER